MEDYMIKPLYDYVLGEEVLEDSGVVTTTNVSDTKQKYKVLAVGEGRYYGEHFEEPKVNPGDIVIIQKHSAEGDTPPELYQKGQALFMATRIMAIEGDK